jgi:hypothetical protein
MTSQNKFVSLQAPKTATALLSTANTTMTDTPTNSQLLFAAHATNGSRLMGLTAMTRATQASAVRVDVWLSKNGGTTKRQLECFLVTAHTVAATTEIPTNDSGLSPENFIDLEAGDSIYVTAAAACDICVAARYADY